MFGSLGFFEGGKLKNREKNPWSNYDNQFNDNQRRGDKKGALQTK